MFHARRRHRVVDGLSFELIAEKVAKHSQCLCTGFRCGALTILNDSITSDDGRHWVYAVVRDGRQIESITVNAYNSVAELVAELMSLNADPLNGVDMGPVGLLPHPAGTCGHCA